MVVRHIRLVVAGRILVRLADRTVAAERRTAAVEHHKLVAIAVAVAASHIRVAAAAAEVPRTAAVADRILVRFVVAGRIAAAAAAVIHTVAARCTVAAANSQSAGRIVAAAAAACWCVWR